MSDSPGGRIRPLVLACLFVTASLIPALDYGFGPGDETMMARREIHKRILTQTATSPDRYRWLSAAIVEVPTRVLMNWMPYDAAYDRASFVFYLCAIVGLLWSLFAYLRVWFQEEAALIAALVAACTIRITMRQHDYGPFSYLEPTFVSLALLFIVKRRYAWLGAVIAIATFNRETAIFIVALYFVTSDLKRQDWLRTIGYGAIWAAVYGLVRVVGGNADRYWTVDLVWNTNTGQPWLAAFNIAMLLGVFWLLAILGWRDAPPFVRRSALVLPFYVITIAVWGIWWEVRLLMPMYPILFPLALSYLYRRGDRPWRAWVLAGIFATIVATSASDYSILVPQPQKRYEMHDAIVNGTAPSPQRYRVLVPFALDPIIKVAARRMDHNLAFRRVYFAFHFFALTALVASVYAYLRLWFSRDRSLIGTLVIASTLHLVLRMGEYYDFSPIPDRSWFAPWSLLEPVLMAWGLIFVYQRRWIALAMVAILAALNSGAVALLFGGWAHSTIGENLAHLPHTTVNLFLFLGPAAALVFVGVRTAPPFARRALLAAIPLLFFYALFSDWWEVRLLTPLYPIIAPLLVAGLSPVRRIHRPAN